MRNLNSKSPCQELNRNDSLISSPRTFQTNNATTMASTPTTSSMYNNSSTTATPEITEFTTGGILKASAVAVLIAVAIVGNVLVCISFAMFRNLRCLTNYFIVSLSISDLLIASCTMPIWLGVQLYQPRPWPVQAFPVRFWHAMDHLLCLGSILSLTAISVERNLAITNPFYYTKWLSPKRVLVAIVGLWLYAIVVSTVTTLNPFEHRVGLGLFIVITSYFLPLLVIFTMYTGIFIVARRQARRLRQDGAFVTDMKAIKTIAIVIGAFIVCYTPFFIVLIWTHFNIGKVASHTISVTKWLTYFNSCLNPIIYSCFNKTYRKAFKRLFKDWGKRIQEFRVKIGTKNATASRPLRRSQISLNVTMRSSAGSLLDGPKTSTDVISMDGQLRRSLHSTQVILNAVDLSIPKACGDLNMNEQAAHEIETIN